MKILVIILIVLFVLDIFFTYLYFRWREKQDKLLLNPPRYTVNTVPVEEFYWSYVLAPSIPLKDKEGSLDWVQYKGSLELAIKMRKLGFIEIETVKYDDGTEKVVLKLKAIRPNAK